jgi:hypothetical protein
MSPLVSDDQALDAFKNAFGVRPQVKKDARIRIGKVEIALDKLEKSILFAHESGTPQNQITALQQRVQDMRNRSAQFAGQTNPNMKELEQLKKQAREFEKRLHDILAKRPLATLPQNSGIYAFDVPGLDTMDKRERDEKIQQVRQQVARGSNISQGVQSKQPPYSTSAPTKDTVQDLCWYLKGMAQAKYGGPFQDGAMTLDDDDGALAKFLDNCPDAYPRKSSHLRPQQSEEGSQGRGLDIPGGFPGDMNTVLWHAFKTETGKTRIYIKFESAGSQKFVEGDKREIARRPENEYDVEQGKQHTLSFIGMGKKPNVRKVEVGQTREGTVNGAVLQAYSDVRDAFPEYNNYLGRNVQKSKQNSEGKITGGSRALSFTPFAPDYWDVQTQTKNITDMVMDIRANAPQRMNEVQQHVGPWMQAMRDAHYDVDAQVRLGDEVVLSTQNDLVQVTSPVPNEGDISDRALTPMIEVLNKQKANQPTLLSGSHDDLKFVYYARLSFPDPRRRTRRIEVLDVLLTDTGALQFADYVWPGTKMERGWIKKGTSKLTRNKFFEYGGNVTTQEMFRGLQWTGWNMANLTQHTHLVKKG